MSIRALLMLSVLLVAGCPGEEATPIPANALPRVTLELNDADLFYKGTTVVVTLSDDDGELCSLQVDHSFDLGATYTESDIFQNTAGTLTEIPCPASGEKLTLVWNLVGDLGDQDPSTAILRVQPFDPEGAGPPAHLLLELRPRGATITGDFVERSGAQGTQWEFLRVGMAHLELTSEGGRTTGEVLGGADDFDEAEYTWSYEVPMTPPDEHRMAFVLDEDEQGEIAAYLPFVWADSDGSGGRDPDEVPVGTANRMLLGYVVPDGDWIDEGWYVLSFDPAAPPQERYTALPADTSVELHLKGYPVFKGEPVLSVANAADVPSTRRFGLVPPLVDPTQLQGITEMTSTPFNPYVPSVSLDLHTDQLVDDHEIDEPWGAFATSRTEESLLLYVDLNQDEALDEGDTVTHFAVRWDDHAPLLLYHVEAEMAFERLWSWAVDDCWTGFNLVTPVPATGDPHDAWECIPLDSPPQIGFVAF